MRKAYMLILCNYNKESFFTPRPEFEDDYSFEIFLSSEEADNAMACHLGSPDGRLSLLVSVLWIEPQSWNLLGAVGFIPEQWILGIDSLKRAVNLAITKVKEEAIDYLERNVQEEV